MQCSDKIVPCSTPTGLVTYTRWGNPGCHSGATLLYSGSMGSSWQRNKGGGTNYICMPNNNPKYLESIGIQHEYNYVYGTEFISPSPNQYNFIALCSVCNVANKSSTIMIPSRVTCPEGWIREYHGYLMSEDKDHPRTMYICVDRWMKFVPGNGSGLRSESLHHVWADCSALTCPPYNANKELTCVMCSK